MVKIVRVHLESDSAIEQQLEEAGIEDSWQFLDSHLDVSNSHRTELVMIFREQTLGNQLAQMGQQLDGLLGQAESLGFDDAEEAPTAAQIKQWAESL